ncbi:MAG: hypothetical protein KDD33_03855 [Bdellovibrionales bacterium]|nr:hypothetical protein [Bdellovibrionales bacterium]
MGNSPKTELFILGSNPNALNRVCQKLAETRPVNVRAFYDLKQFLGNCMQNPPDVVAISMNFPHPAIEKFPRILNMALNTTVIAIGEDYEAGTRKKINNSATNYKIPGLVSAHNLWMKLLIINKSQMTKHKAKDSLAADKKGSFTHVSGSLNEWENIENASSIHVTNFGNTGAHVQGGIQPQPSMMEMILSQLGGSEDGSQPASQMTYIGGDGNKSQVNSTGQSQQGNWGFELPKAGGDSEGGKASELEASKNDSVEQTGPIVHHAKGRLENEENAGEADLGALLEDFMSQLDMEKEDTEDAESQPPVQAFEPQEFQEGIDVRSSVVGETERPSENSKTEDQNLNTDKSFGGVKVADHKDIQKDQREKKKKKKAQEFQVKKSLLEESCEMALANNFSGQPLERVRAFQNSALHAFAIEIGEFKGYILLANSFAHHEEEYVLNDIRTTIIDNLKKNGQSGEVSQSFYIQIPKCDYFSVVDEICDFTVKAEEETGKQILISFLPREKVFPSFHESDREGMLFIDVQNIPPDTPVNFDAFIYPEKNQRFVRYLKNGRSLSLKRVKRLIEEKNLPSLYLPINDKGKYIQFFIENTIQWQFYTHLGQTPAPKFDEAS